MEIIKSQKCKDMLVIDNFIFTKKSMGRNATTWNCRIRSCGARAKTPISYGSITRDQVILWGAHNHVDSPSEITKLKKRSIVKMGTSDDLKSTVSHKIEAEDYPVMTKTDQFSSFYEHSHISQEDTNYMKLQEITDRVNDMQQMIHRLQNENTVFRQVARNQLTTGSVHSTSSQYQSGVSRIPELTNDAILTIINDAKCTMQGPKRLRTRDYQEMQFLLKLLEVDDNDIEAQNIKTKRLAAARLLTVDTAVLHGWQSIMRSMQSHEMADRNQRLQEIGFCFRMPKMARGLEYDYDVLSNSTQEHLQTLDYTSQTDSQISYMKHD